MRKAIGLAMCVMVVGVLGVGAAFGGPLKGLQAEAVKFGPGWLPGNLQASGPVPTNELAAVVAGNWDEDQFVDMAVKNRAWGMVRWVMIRDTFSAASMSKIKAGILADPKASSVLLDIVSKYPSAERADFQRALDAYAGAFAGNRPEWMKFRIKCAMQGIGEFSEAADEADLIRLLLAVEPASVADVQTMKTAVKARAVRLARQGLRAEGRSFVVKGGVNPLEVKVRPVIDALNAQGCAGLEAAFRGLGSTVQDVDRSGLVPLTSEWRTKIMSGEMGGADSAARLGKIALVMGADGYNRFVDEFNNGTAGGK
jgi:hypothetical protein